MISKRTVKTSVAKKTVTKEVKGAPVLPRIRLETAERIRRLRKKPKKTK